MCYCGYSVDKRVFHCLGPEDCNIGKREKKQASCDGKTSSTTCGRTIVTLKEPQLTLYQ